MFAALKNNKILWFFLAAAVIIIVIAIILLTGKPPQQTPESSAAYTWYLAEGFTGAGFGTYISIQNPNTDPTRVNVTYMLEDGTLLEREVMVLGSSRFTIVTQDPEQVGPDKAFSTKLVSDKPIVVERAMYWPNGMGTFGGHVTPGVQQPANTWYLAEGFTGGSFETFFLVQNPNEAEARVTVTYMLDNGNMIQKEVAVPANARFTIRANDETQVGPDRAFSTRLESDQPIIVERAMYFAADGTAASGITTPQQTWYLAEGFTGAGFGTYISIQNPNGAETNVTVTYMYEDGFVLTKEIAVSPNSRYTIVTQDPEQVGPDRAFSTKLEADHPIIVERAMYWANGEGTLAGNDTPGVAQPETTWYLAEGHTGGGFGTYILVQNPNPDDSEVTLTYLLIDGSPVTRSIVVPANSRYTVVAQEEGQIGIDQTFSVIAEGTQPIIVERAMYFPNGGHVAAAVTLAP